MKKSAILKSITREDSNIEKGDSKYGVGKKLQAVTVTNSKGKSFTRTQKVGTDKLVSVQNNVKKLIDKTQKKTMTDLSDDKIIERVHGILKKNSGLPSKGTPDSVILAKYMKLAESRKLDVRMKDTDLKEGARVVTTKVVDFVPKKYSKVYDIVVDGKNKRAVINEDKNADNKDSRVVIMHYVDKDDKPVNNAMMTFSYPKEKLEPAKIPAKTTKPEPTNLTKVTGMGDKFKAALEKTAIKMDEDSVLTELSKVHKIKPADRSGADNARLSVFEKELLVRMNLSDVDVKKPSELSVKELQKVQDQLSNISFKYHTKGLLTNSNDSKDVFQKLSNRYSDRAYEINREIRRKLEKNESGETTSTEVTVPVSKSPASDNKETVTLQVTKKDGAKYAKSGQKSTEHNGFKTGDKVTFEVKGQKIKGVFKHMNINVHSPQGYYVIRGEDTKLYERKPSTVTKL